MFVKINLAVRYVLAFTLMYCSCLSIRAMEQVDDTVDFSAPKFTAMEQVDDTVDFSAPEYCPKHPQDIDRHCVMQSRIACITKYKEQPSKYDDDITICKKLINSPKHEMYSFGRSMSHPNYMTSMEQENLKESLKELKKEEKMRLSDLYDIWGCYCEHYNDEVDEKLNKLKEEFGKDKIYDLINAVKKL